MLVIIILILILLIIFFKISEKFIDTNILNQIDAVIYINLDNRPDRKEDILGELKKMNIPENKIHRMPGEYVQYNGHKGCVKSHINVLNLIQENHWNKVLILEDDATLNVDEETFNKSMNKMLNYINFNKWDVVMLATTYSDKEDLSDGLVKIKSANSSSAYIVNRHYINKLLQVFNYSYSMMSDDKWTENGNEIYALDQQWTKLQREDNWLGWDTDLIKQRQSKSSINEFM